jgi:hypothetical protein
LAQIETWKVFLKEMQLSLVVQSQVYRKRGERSCSKFRAAYDEIIQTGGQLVENESSRKCVRSTVLGECIVWCEGKGPLDLRVAYESEVIGMNPYQDDAGEDWDEGDESVAVRRTEECDGRGNGYPDASIHDLRT